MSGAADNSVATRPSRGRRGRRFTVGAIAAIGVTAMAATGGGCALALSSRAPSDYAPERHGSPDCTATPGRSVADATLAATTIQLGAWWLLSWETEVLPAPPPEILVPVFALGAAHAASAMYGYNHSMRCKEARWTYGQWIRERDAAGDPDDDDAP